MQKTGKLLFGIIAVAVLVLVSFGVINWFLELDTLYPGQFSFTIDPDNLAEQSNGLAWTMSIILTVFYFISSAYLVIEGKVSTVEVQKKFHYGLSVLFLMIGLAQGIVVFYSIFKTSPPFGWVSTYIKGGEALARADVLWALVLACSSAPIIMYYIEKYIKNSKRFVLTVLVVIGTIAGTTDIAMSYVTTVPEAVEWVLIVFTFLSVMVTIIALPSIYISLARQTSGSLKINSGIIATGYLLTFIMIFLHMLRDEIAEDMPLNWVIFIAGNVIGAVILLNGYIKSTY